MQRVQINQMNYMNKILCFLYRVDDVVVDAILSPDGHGLGEGEFREVGSYNSHN